THIQARTRVRADVDSSGASTGTRPPQRSEPAAPATTHPTITLARGYQPAVNSHERRSTQRSILVRPSDLCIVRFGQDLCELRGPRSCARRRALSAGSYSTVHRGRTRLRIEDTSSGPKYRLSKLRLE